MYVLGPEPTPRKMVMTKVNAATYIADRKLRGKLRRVHPYARTNTDCILGGGSGWLPDVTSRIYSILAENGEYEWLPNHRTGRCERHAFYPSTRFRLHTFQYLHQLSRETAGCHRDPIYPDRIPHVKGRPLTKTGLEKPVPGRPAVFSTGCVGYGYFDDQPILDCGHRPRGVNVLGKACDANGNGKCCAPGTCACLHPLEVRYHFGDIFVYILRMEANVEALGYLRRLTPGAAPVDLMIDGRVQRPYPYWYMGERPLKYDTQSIGIGILQSPPCNGTIVTACERCVNRGFGTHIERCIHAVNLLPIETYYVLARYLPTRELALHALEFARCDMRPKCVMCDYMKREDNDEAYDEDGEEEDDEDEEQEDEEKAKAAAAFPDVATNALLAKIGEPEDR